MSRSLAVQHALFGQRAAAPVTRERLAACIGSLPLFFFVEVARLQRLLWLLTRNQQREDQRAPHAAIMIRLPTAGDKNCRPAGCKTVA
jgi:hypothetical protein